jgi:hypothetical protein
VPVEAGRRKSRWTKRIVLGLGVAAVTGLLFASAPSERAVQAATPAPAVSGPTPETFAEVFRKGEAGFVVTEIAYALGPDAKDSGACPAGMTRGVRDMIKAFQASPAGQRNGGEADEAYQRRTLIAAHTAPNGQNICMHPEASQADPGWRSVSGATVRVDGIDLDGQDSAPGKRPAAGTCGHQDFQGTSGQRGIDNQFYRVVGCIPGFQSTGQANGWKIEMYTGAWGILITLKGVDDPRNDPDVQVGIYANADPIQLSAAREALPFATYAVDQDPRYRATTRGRIVNGVLTIDPVDVRVHTVTNAMHDDRVLRDARLKLTFTADGGMEGYLAGYSPVDAIYGQQFGSRTLRTAKGDLAAEPRRIQVAQGREDAFGHTCNGVYYALKQAADGHPDASGHCTSISTQYRIRIAPAFVVDAKTQSVNAPLAMK